MQAVEAGRKRPIRIKCPHGKEPSSDEDLLLTACGMAPLSMEVAERILEPLLLNAASVGALGRALNAAMRMDGMRLPARRSIGVMTPAWAASATLH